ncbi:MAG: hypothetical protein ACLP5V_11625 [Candidatus Bathyarchaeia archaeon]
MSEDILCEECSERYSALLRVARNKTKEMDRRLSGLADQSAISAKTPNTDQTESVLERPVTEALPQLGHEAQLPVTSAMRRSHPASQLAGYLLLGIGLVVLTASVLFASTILTFIGLGLAFWGMLAFFVQPQTYVKSDLMNATAQSSLKTIENMMMGMGYREKGVYIPAGKEKVVVFVPFEPFSMLPESSVVEGETFLKDPQGMLVVPPGLALANLIEKKLGFTLKNCGVETVIRTLPKVLVEDLEIVRDVEIEVKDDRIGFKLVDSIYADFCREMRDTSRRCGLGCPMCSALACILAVASGKPVLFDEDELSEDKRTTYSSYELLNRRRL